jgi:hypothetical protein
MRLVLGLLAIAGSCLLLGLLALMAYQWLCNRLCGRRNLRDKATPSALQAVCCKREGKSVESKLEG